MTGIFDFLIAALASHKKGDGAVAIENYAKAFACAESIGDDEVRSVYFMCKKFIYYYNNGTRADNTMEKNGELLVLTRLAEQGTKVIFDVGANIGYWALTAARANPAATIHSFEIFNDTHTKLVANTASESRILPNGFGLAAQDGIIEVHCADSVESAHFSTVTRFENGQRRACPVRRGDAYMVEAGVERIDFLKIDVEGGEYAVLTGFADALAQGRIPVIQFEYGPASLESRKLLKDYYDLLSDHGYAIGRLHGGGVNFKAYSLLDDENFINANFIACLKGREDLIGALALR